MPWATTTEVAEITGVAVTDEQLGQAQALIELFVGRTEGSQVWPASVSGWLRKAVAYQAAWMPSQPDLFTHSAAVRISQDGASVEFTQDGRLLAPLARVALRKLGWKGTRSIYTPGVGDLPRGRFYPASVGVVGVYDSDDNGAFPDDPWRPM